MNLIQGRSDTISLICTYQFIHRPLLHPRNPFCPRNPRTLLYGAIDSFRWLGVQKENPAQNRDGGKNPRCHPDSPLAGGALFRRLLACAPSNGGRVRPGLPESASACSSGRIFDRRAAPALHPLRARWAVEGRPTRFHRRFYRPHYNWKFLPAGDGTGSGCRMHWFTPPNKKRPSSEGRAPVIPAAVDSNAGPGQDGVGAPER